MGEVYLDLVVANVRRPRRRRTISFLADTGSTWAWLPQETAEALGIQPIGNRALELADGSVRELPYGFCLFGYDGDTVGENVVIGPSQCVPIAGNMVLQSLRISVDPERHTISRRRALRA